MNCFYFIKFFLLCHYYPPTSMSRYAYLFVLISPCFLVKETRDSIKIFKSPPIIKSFARRRTHQVWLILPPNKMSQTKKAESQLNSDCIQIPRSHFQRLASSQTARRPSRANKRAAQRVGEAQPPAPAGQAVYSAQRSPPQRAVL